MPGQYTGSAFETAIERHLATVGGYLKGDRAGFDLDLAIFPDEVLAFIRSTQPEK